jgi:hypothetical protein
MFRDILVPFPSFFKFDRIFSNKIRICKKIPDLRLIVDDVKSASHFKAQAHLVNG